jgi:hypothetical protein
MWQSFPSALPKMKIEGQNAPNQLDSPEVDHLIQSVHCPDIGIGIS